MKIKTCIVIVAILFLSGCHGYRYTIIEDKDAYLLKGEFYNNNPFIKIKAIIPNSYLVKKTLDGTSKKGDIRSTALRDEEILDGFIVDRKTEVEIKLLVFDHRMNEKRPAYENGSYRLQHRWQVEDLHVYLSREENDIWEKFKP